MNACFLVETQDLYYVVPRGGVAVDAILYINIPYSESMHMYAWGLVLEL